MKKLLIIILMALLILLTGFTIVNGLSIGTLTIPGITSIMHKNDEIDLKIAQADKLVDNEYTKKQNELLANAKKLEEQKTKYEDMANVSTEGENQVASQLEKYEVEYLWTKLGNHATSEGVEIKIDVLNAEAGEGNFNLNFTVTGSYVGISEFIAAVENDSSLGFKIENFSLTPGEGNNLLGTFTCKNIMIKDIKANSSQPEPTQNGQEGKNNTTTNTTNNQTSNNNVNTSTQANNTSNTNNTNP